MNRRDGAGGFGGFGGISEGCANKSRGGSAKETMMMVEERITVEA